MDQPQAYDELIRRTKEYSLLESCGSVLGWDERTYMPRQGSKHRGDQMALLARLGHEMLTAPVVGELLDELARVTSQAQQVWERARHDDDFPTFRPWLERIVKLKRQEAQAVGYKDVPYDALLDQFEPGATTAEVTRVFAE